MNLPRVYTCFPSWTPFPPPSPYHTSGSSQSTSPKHPVSCIEPGLEICFIYDIINVSMPFSQIIPPSPSPTESKRLFYSSVSLVHAVSFLWEYTLRSHFDLSQDTLGDMAEVHHIEIQYFWLFLCVSFVSLVAYFSFLCGGVNAESEKENLEIWKTHFGF